MGKKNKDKKHNQDYVTSSMQQSDLDFVDTMMREDIEGVEPSVSTMEYFEDSHLNDSEVLEKFTKQFMGESVTDMLKQRRKERKNEEAREGPLNIDESEFSDGTDGEVDSDVSLGEDLSERLNSESNDEEASEDAERDDTPDPLHKIVITAFRTDAFHVINFSDGVRIFTVDLNTIPLDDPLFDEEDIEPYSFGKLCLKQMMPCMYPGFIMSKDRLNATVRHVTEVDEEKFMFYEYPDGNNNLVTGYYIPEHSMEVFMDICKFAFEHHIYTGFLTSMLNFADANGFAFRNQTVDWIRQLMMAKINESSTKAFRHQLLNDDDTSVSDTHFNESADDVISILPYNFMGEQIESVLEPIDEGDEFVESAGAMDLPELPEEEADTSEEDAPVVEPAKKAEPVVESESSLFDGVDGVEDPDEAEREYYASKGKKPPQEQKHPKKKSDDDDDSKFLIDRR